jgi:hypothetical protein
MAGTFPKFIHWAARLVALVVAAFFIFLITAEVVSPHSRPPSGFAEWTQITLLVCVVLGMLLAWKWELAGAVFSLVALLVWVALVRIYRYPDIIVLLAAPGILYLSDWLLRFSPQPTRD